MFPSYTVSVRLSSCAIAACEVVAVSRAVSSIILRCCHALPGRVGEVSVCEFFSIVLLFLGFVFVVMISLLQSYEII